MVRKEKRKGSETMNTDEKLLKEQNELIAKVKKLEEEIEKKGIRKQPVEPVKKENSERYTIQSIPTQQESMIVDNETNEPLDILNAVKRLLNEVEEIKRGLVG